MNKNGILWAIMLPAFFAIITGSSVPVQAQETWSVSANNWMQYWHNQAIRGDSLADLSRSREDSVDNRFIVDFNFGNFYAGGWLRIYEPYLPNSSYEKLVQRYLGWNDKGITVHAGNFYQVFDRGLTLNTFYDDVVRTDNNLDGIKVSGLYNRFEFDAISSRAYSFNERSLPFSETRSYTIRGARAAGRPIKQVKTGFSYVRFKQNDVNLFDRAANINMTSFNSGFNMGPVDAYAEYAIKRGKADTGEPSKGDGTYLSGSLSRKLFSLYGEYKDFYNLLYPGPQGPFNIPPPASHSGRSLASVTSSPGEAGFQVGTLISPTFDLNFDLAFSESYARGTPVTMQPGDPRNYLSEKYAGVRWSPFELLTLNYHWDRFDLFGRWDKIQYATEIDEIENYLDGYLYVTKSQTVSFSTSTSRYMPGHVDGDNLSSFYEAQATLGFSQGSLFQINVGGSFSNKHRFYDDLEAREPRRMAYGELLIHFGSHDLSLFQGDERGGLVCSSGICTFRPSFKGTRLMLFSRF